MTFFFFLGSNNHSFSHNILFVSLSFCNCPWACYEPFPFMKRIFYGCKAFLEQWACVDRSLLRRLVDHMKSFISQWPWERIEEGALHVYIIHAIDRIKSFWHFVKVLFQIFPFKWATFHGQEFFSCNFCIMCRCAKEFIMKDCEKFFKGLGLGCLFLLKFS